MFQSVLVSSRLGARRDRLVAHRGERFEPRSTLFQEKLPPAARVEVRSSEQKMPIRPGAANRGGLPDPYRIPLWFGGGPVRERPGAGLRH